MGVAIRDTVERQDFDVLKSKMAVGRLSEKVTLQYLSNDITTDRYHSMAWAEAYLRTKWHLDPSIRLTATDMGRNLGAVPLWGSGSWVPI